MDYVGGKVVDSAVRWIVLLGEDAADHCDGMAERSVDLEAQNHGNPRFDVRKDVAVDGGPAETKRLIPGFTDRTYHSFGREEFRSSGKRNGLGPRWSA